MANKIYELDGYPVWMVENWHKWYDVARSYRRAAQILLDAEVPELDYYSERDVLPILHLLQHFAELILKCLLIRNGEPIHGSHDLAQLLAKVEKIYPRIFSAETAEFLRFLNSTHPQGMALRYPTDKANREFFAGSKGASSIEPSYLHPPATRMFDDVRAFFKREIFASDPADSSVIVVDLKTYEHGI